MHLILPLVFIILCFSCIVNCQIFTTTGQGHGNRLNLLLSLQDEVNRLKTEHALTLSLVSNLQHDLRVAKEEFWKQKEYNTGLIKDVICLKNLTGDCNLGKNRLILRQTDLDKFKDAFAIELDLNLKQQKEDFMNQIPKIKGEHNEKLGATSTMISGISGSISAIQAKTTPKTKVHFSAGTTGDINKQWSYKETILFPHVISNVGGGYDASTGIFTAPHIGGYVLTCFLSAFSYALDANLVLNGSPIVSIHTSLATGVESTGFGTSGNCVALQLAQGDRVWLEHVHGNVIWARTAPISTFSGFYIG